jgi:hypothetical protein
VPVDVRREQHSQDTEDTCHGPHQSCTDGSVVDPGERSKEALVGGREQPLKSEISAHSLVVEQVVGPIRLRRAGRDDKCDGFRRHEGSDAAPRPLGAPGQHEIRNEDEGRDLDRGGQSRGHTERNGLPSEPSGPGEIPHDEEGDEHVDLTVADGQKDWIQEEGGCGQAQSPQTPRPPREVRAHGPDRESEQAKECRLVQQCPQDLGSDRAREALQRHEEERGERWIREQLSPGRLRVEGSREQTVRPGQIDAEIILIGAGEPEAKGSHEGD